MIYTERESKREKGQRDRNSRNSKLDNVYYWTNGSNYIFKQDNMQNFCACNFRWL